jgi:hypothetical protein
VYHLFKMGRLTDEQVAVLYALAEKCKVSIQLWQDSPSPVRESSTWAASGGLPRVIRFFRRLRSMR